MHKFKWLVALVGMGLVGSVLVLMWPEDKELLTAVSPDGTWVVSLRVSEPYLNTYLVAKDSSGQIIGEKYVNSFDMIEDISYDIFCTNEEAGVGHGSRDNAPDWRNRYVIIAKPR